MQTDHPTIPTALSALLALALSSCAFPDLPDDGDFTLYQNTYRNRAAGEYADLDRQLADGTLSTDDHNTKRQQLESRITADAHDALLRHKQLSDSS